MTNTIHEYIDIKGNSPYLRWLEKLRDKRAKLFIALQVDKMEIGLFGDSKPIGEGLSELRIHYGPGYRVYYAKNGKADYLILCAGNKSTQVKDIKLAKSYWQEYQKRR